MSRSPEDKKARRASQRADISRRSQQKLRAIPADFQSEGMARVLVFYRSGNKTVASYSHPFPQITRKWMGHPDSI
jgi:hypothetical protein